MRCKGKGGKMDKSRKGRWDGVKRKGKIRWKEKGEEVREKVGWWSGGRMEGGDKVKRKWRGNDIKKGRKRR